MKQVRLRVTRDHEPLTSVDEVQVVDVIGCSYSPGTGAIISRYAGQSLTPSHHVGATSAMIG